MRKDGNLKTITILLLVLATKAFAQDEFNVVKNSFHMPFYISRLSCVFPVIKKGQGYTELKHTFNQGTNTAIEMNHQGARAAGCDQEALAQLLDVSAHRFGFVPATVTVTKNTAKLPRLVSGQCQRNYSEQIEIDFGQGTVLQTTKEGKLILASGCLAP